MCALSVRPATREGGAAGISLPLSTSRSIPGGPAYQKWGEGVRPVPARWVHVPVPFSFLSGRRGPPDSGGPVQLPRAVWGVPGSFLFLLFSLLYVRGRAGNPRRRRGCPYVGCQRPQVAGRFRSAGVAPAPFQLVVAGLVSFPTFCLREAIRFGHVFHGYSLLHVSFRFQDGTLQFSFQRCRTDREVGTRYLVERGGAPAARPTFLHLPILSIRDFRVCDMDYSREVGVHGLRHVLNDCKNHR